MPARLALLLSLLVALIAALARPAPLLAQEPDPRVLEEAAARYDRGIKLFDAGDYPGALAEFEAVYRLTSRWEVLFNIAVTQKKLFRYGKAVRSLERYLAEGGAQVDAPRRQAVERELTEIRSLVAEITVIVEGAPADIEVDGLLEGTTPLDRPLLLGSGRHVIRASRSGELADEKAIEVVSGQNATVKLEPKVKPKEQKTAKITVDSSPPGAILTIDGKEVGKAPWTGELGAGGHQVTAMLEGHDKARQEVVVVGGQERRVVVELVRTVVVVPPKPIYKKWWFWGGVGVAAAAAATTFIVISLQPEDPDVVIEWP
jgi:hypothetical protein